MMMYRIRVIPVLLLRGHGLYKGINFSKHRYVGDPINTVRIFNDKEVDEIVILDIDATLKNKKIDFNYIEEIVSEAFMPLGYGGGIRDLETIERLFSIGIEKIVINTKAAEDVQFIRKASEMYGSQSIVVSIDVKKTLFGKYEIYTHSGTKKTNLKFEKYLKTIQDAGAGEVILTSINQEGTMKGYDLHLIKLAASQLHIPLIASGGAGNLKHFTEAYQAGASAVAAGSMFVFYGKHRAVLVNYPSPEELEKCFKIE